MKMMRKGVAISAALLAGALILPTRAGAIEVKKDLYSNGGGGAPSGGGGAPSGGASSMGKAQQQALQEAVATDSEQYVDQESEKKSSGQGYVDLANAKPRIFPSSSGVTVKLEAAEYKAKGKKTGNQKALVFKYKQSGSKYTLDGEPKWEDVAGAK